MELEIFYLSIVPAQLCGPGELKHLTAGFIQARLCKIQGLFKDF